MGNPIGLAIHKRKIKMKKNHHERGTINNELVWLLSGKRILVGDINKPQHNKYKTNNNCIPYITAQSVPVVVYTITDVLPSAQQIINWIFVINFSFSSLFHIFDTSHHRVTTEICLSIFCLISGLCATWKFIY
jgi:hypothetical protein